MTDTLRARLSALEALVGVLGWGASGRATELKVALLAAIAADEAARKGRGLSAGEDYSAAQRRDGGSSAKADTEAGLAGSHYTQLSAPVAPAAAAPPDTHAAVLERWRIARQPEGMVPTPADWTLLKIVGDELAERLRVGSAAPETPQSDEVARLKRVVERDRTAYQRGVNRLREIVASRRWLKLSRGSYEWDDDNYRKEFGWALGALERCVAWMEGACHGRDLSDSPETQEEVDLARSSLPASPERTD